MLEIRTSGLTRGEATSRSFPTLLFFVVKMFFLRPIDRRRNVGKCSCKNPQVGAKRGKNCEGFIKKQLFHSVQR
jgi:hypothetical protein